MRITNQMISNNSLRNMQKTMANVDNRTTQMETGKKITKPSEDPVVAIRALRLRSNLSEINQYYEKNIPDADAWLDETETALENMKTILSDIRTQCTYGASDQLKAEDRKTILTQLESLRKQIYSEGNSDYAGRTVFTGYRTNCKLTFMEDESLQRPSQASFQIVKLKPIDAHTVEVYTKSDCNGVWFGLCKGNIIYVLNNRSGNWTVKDIYALQSI